MSNENINSNNNTDIRTDKRANNRKTGADKEAFVCEWLAKQGYLIRERNFRCRSGEIDIVASEAGYLVFVEVKYRRGTGAGEPEEAVDWKKQKIISKVALFYLNRYGYGTDTPVRFDVVAVSGDEELECRLYQNAFEFCGYQF